MEKDMIGFIQTGEKGDLIPVENIEGREELSREELKGSCTPLEFLGMYARNEIGIYQTSSGVKVLKT